jgi:galactokinase
LSATEQAASRVSSEKLRAQFRERFGGEPRLFSAPGRINLIGEHTDYNDGFVLPMAIDRRTFVAGRARDDRRLRAGSVDFAEQVEFEINADLLPAEDWGNHVRGMAACLERAGHRLQGADLLIASEVPIGAGLSSSAALEIAVGYALLALAGESIELRRLAFAAQRAEHEFAGTRSGIMDQFTACFGQPGQALLLDCRSLDYSSVALDLSAMRVVACDSKIKHDLAAGEYNQRRAECEEGARLLGSRLPQVTALRDITLSEFEQHSDLLPEVVRRRCRHVITENLRTLEAAAALDRRDMERVGSLMYASHASLRDDYEVSCRELDLLVEIAAKCEGVIGARMTGGGFGGCTVNLVATEQLDNFAATVSSRYERETGIQPEIYVCQAVGGVREETPRLGEGVLEQRK